MMKIPDQKEVLAGAIERLVKDKERLEQELVKQKAISRRMANKIVELKRKQRGCL